MLRNIWNCVNRNYGAIQLLIILPIIVIAGGIRYVLSPSGQEVAMEWVPWLGGFVQSYGEFLLWLIGIGALVWIWLTLSNLKSRLVALETPIIVEAKYGIDGHWRDIREHLQSKFVRGTLKIEISNEIAGDPADHVRKVCKVKYVSRGVVYEREVKENDFLVLP